MFTPNQNKIFRENRLIYLEKMAEKLTPQLQAVFDSLLLIQPFSVDE